MKRTKLTKQSVVLGITVLVLAGSLAVPGPLAAQEPQPPFLHPYGKAWEEHRPRSFAKQEMSSETAASPAPLQPSAFANEHRMVFESYRDNQYEIYAADGDGNGAVRLTSTGFNRFPKLRYGAIRVGFTHGSSGSRDLWSVRKDGSAQKQLSPVQGHSDVAWSPDGTKMAYARRATTTDVYVASFDFAANTISGEMCLTCGSGRSNFEPTWSPDGKQIVFVKASATEPKGALWRMNADGSGQQALTGEQWWIADVRWSPDGTQVAFDYAPSKEAWQRLGALTLATGKIREVYNPNQNRVDAWMGSWSPDNQMLFFTRVEYVEQDGKLYIGKSWIERVNANGSGRVRLPGNSGMDAMPSVQRRDLVAPVSRVRKLPRYSLTNSIFSVQAFDPGGAGLKSDNTFGAEVYYAFNPGHSGNWWSFIDAREGLGGIAAGTGAQPGQTVYFWSVATDNEGNVEPLPANSEEDTFTTLYAADFVGKMVDIRGLSIPSANISVAPAPLQPISSRNTEIDGSLALKLLGPNRTNRLDVSHAGFQPLATTILEEVDRRSLPIILPPHDNLIKNGGFEINLTTPSDWLVGSAGVQVVTSQNQSPYKDIRFSGKNGLVFGCTLCYPTPAQMSQTVSLTPTLINPTFAFAHTVLPFLATASDSEGLVIEVNDGISSTVVFSKAGTSGDPFTWTYEWFDMTPWNGKVITLSFRSKNFSGTMLDDIMLGSWLTPVPTQTSISQLPANAPAQQITITGTNFIATPTVKLNNAIPLVNVQWLTETQLMADLPANLPPGIYDLWVTNPGGQESVLPNAIRVGQQVYLPLARKEE
jgi:TolB protein